MFDASVFTTVRRALWTVIIDIAISRQELPEQSDPRFAIVALTPREDARDLIICAPTLQMI